MTARRIALLAGAIVCALLVVTSAPALGATSAACAPSCDGRAVATSHSSSSSSLVCIRDASCGGGAAVSFSALATPAALAIGSAAVALVLVARRRRSARVALPLGVLLGSGLFRPPRPAFVV
jgi:hypothetical protein